MRKAISFKSATLVVAVVFPQASYAGECTPASWTRVKSNLEWTANNNKGCVLGRIQRPDGRPSGENSYEAFYHCNSSFRDGSSPDKKHNDYIDCARQVCSWFRAERYTPSCFP